MHPRLSPALSLCVSIASPRFYIILITSLHTLQRGRLFVPGNSSCIAQDKYLHNPTRGSMTVGQGYLSANPTCTAHCSRGISQVTPFDADDVQTDLGS